MAITEENRHRLYQRLEEVLGAEQAATLIEHFPPVGWADVATKRDVEVLASVLRGNIDQLGDRLRAEWRREQLNLMFAMLTANATLAGIAFAAARLT
jgi:hypothetical protein